MDDIMNITVYNSAHIWVYLLNAKLWVTPKAKLEMFIRNTHIRSVNFWVTMVVFNQDIVRKVEFCEYKMYLDVCVCVCVCVCMCVFISLHRRGFSWLKQNKCNARDQVSDVALRKLLCVKNLHRHVIDNHSRDRQASNSARVSIKPGGATRSKRQLLIISTNQR